jgi:hypothetical protein
MGTKRTHGGVRGRRIGWPEQGASVGVIEECRDREENAFH